MVIKIKVPEELARQAEIRGVPVEAYVEEILSARASIGEAQIRQARTPEEIRIWLNSLAQLSDAIPPLPETITRESIYLDHD